jgi:general secretion pathway protein M
MAYLHGIETSKNMIFVKRLSISKAERKPDLITTVFQVETLEK